jgi:hypothetical protein
MRINGPGAMAAAVGVQTVAARRKEAPPRPVSVQRAARFEARMNDVPTGLAGTVRRQGQALVAGERVEVGPSETNACGSIALWLALGQFGRATQDWRQLDAELRPWTLGTSPGVLVDGARDRGLQANVYNHGTFDELERETRHGRAVLVMVEVEPHWLRVKRAWRDSLGRKWVESENPGGLREVLRYEAFESHWRDQRLGAVPTGYDRAYVSIDRAKARPLPTTTADDVMAVMTVTDGAQTFVRGVDALLRGQTVIGLSRAVAGVAATAFGALGASMALPGLWLQGVGGTLLNVARNAFERPAVVGGVLVGAAGLVATGVGAIISSVGNAVGFVGQALSAMSQGALGALGRVFG